MPNPSSERRHPRVAVRLDARISSIDSELDAGTGQSYFRCSSDECTMLSDGGAFVQSDETLPPGRRVVLEITLPGESAPVEALGRIAWSRARLTPEGISDDSGMGIEFLSDSTEHLSRIAHFVAALASAAERAQPQRESASSAENRSATVTPPPPSRGA